MEDPPFFNGSVGIIGGRGRLGSWLADFLERAGCRVRVADHHDSALAQERAAACRVLILSVPISQMEPVMRRLGPATRPDGLVLDLCSVKQTPLEAMLAHARGAVVGCHPLFGPGLDSLEGQVVFLCQGRGEAALREVQNFIFQTGAKPVLIDPQKHDRLMAQVQTMRHFVLAALGGALQELGFDPLRDRSLAGPWSGALLELLGRQLEQPGKLYAELAAGNPQAPEAVRSLGRIWGQMQTALEAGDRQALAGHLDRPAAFLRAMGGTDQMAISNRRPADEQQNLDTCGVIG
jgi:prephenate dehydrogenase